MEVYYSFVDWQEAENRSIRGTFEADIMNASEEDSWIQETEFDDVLSAVFSLGGALDSIAPECSPRNREALEGSLCWLLTEESEIWNELPKPLDPEVYWFAIKPETVRDIRLAASSIDFDELKQLYDTKCPEKFREDLEYTGDEFVDHLKHWCTLLGEADQGGRGLIASVG